MLSTEQIIEGKYLSVCPPLEAVRWLKERREADGEFRTIPLKDYAHEEIILAQRNDPFIDWGLARYGTSKQAGRIVYSRGDLGIRCTYLAHFPNGGYHFLFHGFELYEQPPRELEELRAFASNASLQDQAFGQMFEQKGPFEKLSEEDYQSILVSAADNKRLQAHYDDTILDGYANYSFHKVFSQAWELANRVPVTMPWAHVLYTLLQRCNLPHGFDAVKALSRWYQQGEEKLGAFFYLRSRLADTIAPEDALLKSNDPALRVSFYRRFEPHKYRDWTTFTVDTEYFLDSAMYNENLWKTAELRDALNKLAWAHPDPNHQMDMPQMYNFAYEHMAKKYPQWFEQNK